MGSTLPTSSPTAGARIQSLLSVKGLCKQYVRGGLWQKRVPVAAARDVDFEIPRGQTLALVGESGSGKSTVARCATRLERPDSGQILIQGTDIAQLDSRDLLPFRSSIQMVFQDAVTSMNPRFSALEVIEEPLLIDDRGSHVAKGRRNRQNRRDLSHALMVEVGLSPDWMNRSILHFTGGPRPPRSFGPAPRLPPPPPVLGQRPLALGLSPPAPKPNLLPRPPAAPAPPYSLIS